MYLIRLATLASLAVLGGCGVQPARVAKTAQDSLVGTSGADLDLCAGLPSKTQTIDGRTEIRQYDRTTTGTNGVTVSLPIIGGGLNLTGGGYCHAIFKLVDGRVTQLSYAGDTSESGSQDALCAPIVQACVRQAEQHSPTAQPAPQSAAVTQAGRGG